MSLSVYVRARHRQSAQMRLCRQFHSLRALPNCKVLPDLLISTHRSRFWLPAVTPTTLSYINTLTLALFPPFDLKPHPSALEQLQFPKANMLNMGKKLFSMYSSKFSNSEGDGNPTPAFGRSTDPTKLLSSMAEAVSGDNKWKLTNIGGIGSDEDKQLREKAAESEPQFEGAGQTPGIEIWRIEKFQPEKITARTGNLSLYSGDCYIILNTIELESGQFEWQLHYWIGKDSSQDESGSAAYFTVNIDDLLDQKVRCLHVTLHPTQIDPIHSTHLRFLLFIAACATPTSSTQRISFVSFLLSVCYLP